jgi:hypothetical protein
MEQESAHVMGWWYARFRIKWPENTEPSWHIDLLMAHKIIAPVLYVHAKDISMWRFHRRAARDVEGHQFSMTFYSSQKTAVQIFGSLKGDRLLKRLKRSGIILKDIYDDTGKPSAFKIEDTSDGTWAPEIRKSWPFFIMGVCQMWLSLIVQTAENMSGKEKSLSVQKSLVFYQRINEAIQTLWREQGCHSMLHHLNAIYGYEPVLVREVYLRRF